MKRIFLLGVAVTFLFSVEVGADAEATTATITSPMVSLRYDFDEGDTTKYTIQGSFPLGTDTFVIVVPRYSSLGLAVVKKGVKTAKGFSPEEQEKRFARPRAKTVKEDLLARGYPEERIILFEPEEGGSEVRIYFFPFLLREEAKEIVTSEWIQTVIREELKKISDNKDWDPNIKKIEEQIVFLEAKLRSLEEIATATMIATMTTMIVPSPPAKPKQPTVRRLMKGMVVEANLPHYLRIGKEFSRIPFRIDLTKGFDQSGKWWGGGISWLPTEKWEISLIGVKDEFRKEKVIVTDIQLNYTFFRYCDLKISIGLDCGMISSFNVENIKIEGRRVFPLLNFTFKKPQTFGEWNFVFYYSPEFVSLSSGSFKEKDELGFSFIYQFSRGGAK